MRLLTKEFYTLAELQEAWEMPDQDIQYLIATGRLKLSIMVYSQTLVTVPPGPHLPTDAKRRVYSGMLDLNPPDAVTILRKGEAPTGEINIIFIHPSPAHVMVRGWVRHLFIYNGLHPKTRHSSDTSASCSPACAHAPPREMEGGRVKAYGFEAGNRVRSKIHATAN